ncbi:MAG: hypothetical protein KF893_17555 [Caldilineaceae bacterium]|nr:hypothetical protein [Caldilineaceae bacterium]
MKTFTVGEFKTDFSEIIARVRAGEEIIISYGKKKRESRCSYSVCCVQIQEDSAGVVAG